MNENYFCETCGETLIADQRSSGISIRPHHCPALLKEKEYCINPCCNNSTFNKTEICDTCTPKVIRDKYSISFKA